MRIMILGNGFDLDLGINAKIPAFYNCTNSVKNLFMPGGLQEYLKTQSDKLGCWFDLEEEMASYVKKISKPNASMVDCDKCFLKSFKEDFYNYIGDCWMEKSSLLWREPFKQSLARKLVEKQHDLKYFDKIYSFNCLDYSLLGLASSLELEDLYDVVYLHCHSSNIIFGIAEEDCSVDDYSFLIKKNQYGYPVKEVEVFKKDLLKASEVVIFGHSLNRIDMSYFKRFLEYFPETKQNLFIVTKDEKSKKRIENNISQYVIPFETLEVTNRVNFILTDDYYKNRNSDVIDSLLCN